MMLEWTPDLSVNIAQIDEQHTTLIAMLSRLDAAIKSGQPHTELVSGVIAFAEQHFQSEENLMDRYGFPGTAIHRSAHNRIIMQAREISNAPDNAQLVTGIIDFLNRWLRDHIMTYDKEYSRFLNEKGVR